MAEEQHDDRSAWIEHRRADGELVGWMLPDGDGFRTIDVLGLPVTDAVDWLSAEEALEARGLAFLAEPWLLDGVASEPLRVRIVEVSTDRILVKKDDWGAIDAPQLTYELPFPAPATLRPHDGRPNVFPMP